MSLGALSYTAVPILLEFFSPSARAGQAAAGNFLVLVLCDGSTVLGQLGVLYTAAAQPSNHPVFAVRRLTPSAGSHTYNVKAYVNAGSGVVRAGAGGAGGTGSSAATDLPGFIRAVRL